MGKVAEWSKANDSKSFNRQLFVGSNPTLSVTQYSLTYMLIVTWDEFNLCVESITNTCRDKELCGVYGFPRGGICLAVALSHSLNIPLLQEPKSGCLVVDDVYETGKTLKTISENKKITNFVWFSKSKPEWWNAVNVIDPDEWIIFPWENRKLAETDKKIYLSSRL